MRRRGVFAIISKTLRGILVNIQRVWGIPNKQLLEVEGTLIVYVNWTLFRRQKMGIMVICVILGVL